MTTLYVVVDDVDAALAALFAAAKAKDQKLACAFGIHGGSVPRVTRSRPDFLEV